MHHWVLVSTERERHATRLLFFSEPTTKVMAVAIYIGWLLNAIAEPYPGRIPSSPTRRDSAAHLSHIRPRINTNPDHLPPRGLSSGTWFPLRTCAQQAATCACWHWLIPGEHGYLVSAVCINTRVIEPGGGVKTHKTPTVFLTPACLVSVSAQKHIFFPRYPAQISWAFPPVLSVNSIWDVA